MSKISNIFTLQQNQYKLDSATGKNNLDNHTIFRSLLTLINQIKIMCKKHENANRKKTNNKGFTYFEFSQIFYWNIPLILEIFSQFNENVKDIKSDLGTLKVRYFIEIEKLKIVVPTKI